MKERDYYFDLGNGKIVANEEAMLAYLLDEDVIFYGWTDDLNNKHSVLVVNINDCFIPAADGEEINHNDVAILFELYKLKGFDGVCEFVANKRKIPNIYWRDKIKE